MSQSYVNESGGCKWVARQALPPHNSSTPHFTMTSLTSFFKGLTLLISFLDCLPSVGTVSLLPRDATSSTDASVRALLLPSSIKGSPEKGSTSSRHLKLYDSTVDTRLGRYPVGRIHEWTDPWRTRDVDSNASYLAVGEVLNMDVTDYRSIFLVTSAFDELRTTVHSARDSAFDLQLILRSKTPPLNIKMQGEARQPPISMCLRQISPYQHPCHLQSYLLSPPPTASRTPRQFFRLIPLSSHW